MSVLYHIQKIKLKTASQQIKVGDIKKIERPVILDQFSYLLEYIQHTAF